MYHYYLPLQQLLTHIYSDTIVDIGFIEPKHLSTLHHIPERQERIHTHINFKFIVSCISHNKNPKFIATEESPSKTIKNVLLLCFISLFHFKDVITKELQSHLVYKFTCCNYNVTYYGKMSAILTKDLVST